MKRYLILAIVLILSLPVYAQKKITLDEAITIALQRNTSLIKLKYNMDASQALLKNAWGDLLPSLGAQGNFRWTRVDDKGGQQVFYGGIEQATQPSITESRSYSVGVGGSITLFNGLSNYATISQKQDNLKSNEYSITKQKQNIVYQTTFQASLDVTARNIRELYYAKTFRIKMRIVLSISITACKFF